MKKLALLTAIATLLGSLTIASPVSAEEQPLDLGGGWKITNVGAETEWGGRTKVEITDRYAHSGKYSLYFDSVDNKHTYWIEHDAIASGKYYGDDSEANKLHKWTVSFYTKSTSNDWLTGQGDDNTARYKINIGVAEGDNDFLSKLVHEKVVWGETDENGWTKGSFDIGWYNGSTPSFKIKILGSVFGTYIDDIEVKYSGTEPILSGQNISLLTGGDFEPLTETGEDIADYGWTSEVSSSVDSAPIIDIVADLTGNKMMRVRGTSTTDIGWAKALCLHKKLSLPNTVIDWNGFLLTFKAKGMYRRTHVEVGNDDYSHLRFLTGNGGYTSEWLTATPLEDGWTQYTVRSNGKIEDSTIDFSFYSTIPGEFYIDDVCVREIDTDSNDRTKITKTYIDSQLFNGSFDAETESKVNPDRWGVRINEAVDEQFVTRSNKFAYSGNNSLYVQAPITYLDNRFIQIYQTLPAGMDYTKDHTLKMKVKTLSPETTLRVQYTKPGGNEIAGTYRELCSLDEAVSYEYLGDGWYEYTTTLEAYDGITAAELSIFTMYGLDATWIDDVTLTDENGNEYVVNGRFEEYTSYSINEPYIILDGLDTIWKPQVGENTLCVPVTTLEAGMDYYVYFAVYKDGQLYKVQKTEYLDAPVGTKDVEATITIEEDENYTGSYTAKAFVWDENMSALCEAFEFPIYHLYESLVYTNTDLNQTVTSLPYRLHVPEEYDPNGNYPLVVWLHGAGERGTDNEKPFNWYKTSLTKFATDNECIIVVPQCPTDYRWVETDWGAGNYSQDNIAISQPMNLLVNLLDELENEYSIDTNREYVFGVSMGGFGTWDLITRYPDRFAAAMPVCGGADPSKASLIKDMPIWTFHGTADDTVPYSGTAAMVEALEAVGGNIRFSSYEGVTHYILPTAEAEADYFTWMFEQSK